MNSESSLYIHIALLSKGPLLGIRRLTMQNDFGNQQLIQQ